MAPIIREKVDLLNHGPAVDLYMGYEKEARWHAKSVGRKLGPPIQLKGIFDTGAKESDAQLSALRELGLHPVGEVQVRTANKTEWAPVYSVEIKMEDYEFSIPVLGMIMGGGVEFLIGRDILSHGNFNYDGVHKSFKFEINS